MLTAQDVRMAFYPSLGLGAELTKFWSKGKKDSGVLAVRGVSLTARAGEILGLVGESGSGKSTLGRLMGGIYKPIQGRILFQGRDLNSFDFKERRNFNKKVQFMFQDPASSLNPRQTAMEALAEGLIIHRLGSRTERHLKIERLLEEVGLSPQMSSRYPHQFSGGQRQRLCLARALSLDPMVLIADEPASALDVSIQAQIINLLLDLKVKRGLTVVLISHDLALVCLMADRLAVMYGGLIMEIFPRSLFGQVEHHPYVKALLASAETSLTDDLILEGEPPDPQNPPLGCPFHPRCPEFIERCRQSAPALCQTQNSRWVACYLRS